MPAKAAWNTKLAKTLYCRGIPVAEVAKQVGVKMSTLRTTIVRKGWSQAKRSNEAELVPVDAATLAPWLDARARKWLVETVELLNKVTFQAARIDLPEGWRGIREVIQTLKDLIPAGRALYGLDQKGQDSQRQQVAIMVRGSVTIASSSSDATSVSPSAERSVDNQGLACIDVVTVNQEDKETDPLPVPPVA